LPCARRTTLRSSTPAAARGHDSWVYGVAFSPRGDLIATASWDQTARIWDAATGACLATLAGHAGTVEAALPVPRGGTAISSKYRANPSPAGTMEHWAGRIPAAQGDLARR